jgi:ABC-2 type transport system permease protein
MMRPSRVRAIARFEFLSVVRRVSFLVVTFGMPAFFGLLFGLAALLQTSAITSHARSVTRIGLIDPEHRALAPDRASRESGAVRLEQSESERVAMEAVRLGVLDGYAVIESDYVATGRVRLVLGEQRAADEIAAATVREALASVLRERLLRSHLPPDLAERAMNPLSLEQSTLRADGAREASAGGALSSVARLILPLMMGSLLMMALLSSSSYLVQAIALDKESRVVEVLLAAAKPNEILTGKLLGLGAAGLTQFAVWSSMLVVGASLLALRMGLGAGLVPWTAVILLLPYFLLGYLFVGSLMLATGSFGTTLRETQQYAMMWSLPVVLPLALSGVLLFAPHGLLARVLTFVPFTAPVTMVLRLSLDRGSVSAWEIAASLLVLALSVWLALAAGSRLFRVGLLLTGARPSWRQIWRQARLSSP